MYPFSVWSKNTYVCLQLRQEGQRLTHSTAAQATLVTMGRAQGTTKPMGKNYSFGSHAMNLTLLLKWSLTKFPFISDEQDRYEIYLIFESQSTKDSPYPVAQRFH